MTNRMNEIVAPGRVAVITGAAKGIGAAAASAFARQGMKLALLDQDADALASFADSLETEAVTVVGDAADLPTLERLHEVALDRFGDVSVLMSNAGIHKGAGPWGDLCDWKRQLEVNFWGVLLAQYVFVPTMISADKPSAIVNLGSKEGITTPPGNAAYSVAKAGVKVLTEQLSHELLKETGGKVTAHLFVPGYTWTPMNFPGMNAATDAKPPEPWTAQQLLDYFMGRFMNEDFYILCPDNAVTSKTDAKRIQWAADDLIKNRPALSRWNPEWKEQFARWMND